MWAPALERFKGEALGSQANQAHAESHLGPQVGSHPIHVNDHVVVSDHGSLASDRRAQSRPARGPADQVRYTARRGTAQGRA